MVTNSDEWNRLENFQTLLEQLQDKLNDESVRTWNRDQDPHREISHHEGPMKSDHEDLIVDCTTPPVEPHRLNPRYIASEEGPEPANNDNDESTLLRF
jgi:hypothetical protein